MVDNWSNETAKNGKIKSSMYGCLAGYSPDPHDRVPELGCHEGLCTRLGSSALMRQNGQVSVVRAVCALRMPSRSTAAQLNGNKHSLWMNTLFGNLVSASGTTPTGDERHHTRNTRYLHGFDDERRRPLYLRSASIIAFYHYNIEWTHQLLFGPLERASPANEGLLYAFTLRLHTIAWASTP
ncbi:hypothetical protein B0H11DRAFT_1921179 [Mycena galericulata]|nr:hypothetical protein B0H11DRAFT_1921179 [Mycena galericulata]